MNSPSFPLSERPATDKATFVEVEASELEAVNGGFGLLQINPIVGPVNPVIDGGWCGTRPPGFHGRRL